LSFPGGLAFVCHGGVSRNAAALAEVPAGTRKQSTSMTLEDIRALLPAPWFWRP
jgi:hypothetical protein